MFSSVLYLVSLDPGPIIEFHISLSTVFQQMFSGCSEINVSTSDYNEQSRALADLIYLAQKLSSSLAAFNQRFDQFYHEQTDPNVLVQDFPAYLDPYYSTYRSLGGWNFNFMKVIPFNVFTSTLRPSRFWSGFPC